MLKEIIFNAETVAHMKGYEREILPATDAIKELYRLLEAVTKAAELQASKDVVFIPWPEVIAARRYLDLNGKP